MRTKNTNNKLPKIQINHGQLERGRGHENGKWWLLFRFRLDIIPPFQLEPAVVSLALASPQRSGGGDSVSAEWKLDCRSARQSPADAR